MSMTTTVPAVEVKITKVSPMRVQFRASGDCVLQFVNPKMFGFEFLNLEREKARTITYLEETQTMYYVYVPEPSVDSKPKGPIVTP